MSVITTEWNESLSEAALLKCVIGRRVTSIEKREGVIIEGTDHYSGATRVDEAMVFTLGDSATLYLYDDGQSCCENRYMTCDDDLASFVGRSIAGIEQVDGQTEEGEYGYCHEQVFVKVIMDDGTNIAITSHNEHNGYYGGFSLNMALVSGDAA